MHESIWVGQVSALSAKGHGVVKGGDGRTYFVPGTWPQDLIRFGPASQQGPAEAGKKERYAQGELIEVIAPSPERAVPPCPHLGTRPGECSGCPWMIAGYEAQLRQKFARLKHALQKRALPSGPDVLRPIWGSPGALGHRNRAQLKTDGLRLGFVSEGTSTIAPVEDCLALNARARDVLKALLRELPREDWRPGPGFNWNYLDIDEDMGPEVARAPVLNRRRPFRQANNEQNARMRQWLSERLAALSFETPVLELFCGSGNFTEVISSLGLKRIAAVEVAGQALEALRSKNLPGVQVLGLDLYSRAQWQTIEEAFPGAQVLVMDPPRQGLMKKRAFFQHFRELKRIHYISCQAESFCVDAVEFVKRGWRLEEIRPIDQFPHTPHVEILSTFSRS